MTTPIISPKIYVKEIADLYTRTNFQNLSDYFAANNQLLNFKFFEINETKAVTNKTLTHNLGVLPKDIVTTLYLGPGTLSWNYVQFNSSTVTYSTTGAVRMRFLIGTFNGDTSTVPFNKSDTAAGSSSSSSGTGGSVKTVTAAYTATGSEALIIANAAAGVASLAITLPAASSSSGKTLTITKGDKTFGGVVVQGAGADTIFLGATSPGFVTLYIPSESISLTSDGTIWRVTSSVRPSVEFEYSGPSAGQNYATNGASQIVAPIRVLDAYNIWGQNQFATPFPGTWHFESQLTFTAYTASSGGPLLSVFLGGVEKKRGVYQANESGAAAPNLGSIVNTELSLQTGQVVAFYVTKPNGSTLATDATTYVRGRFLHY